ncbi:hypothetical protein J2125_001239 [Erwinia toletana]|uniref:Uncharacterized protein n=1 Tax=Winslowiella toletana TaxID=92490 RepID=A0ABS4P5Y1_9GAMM|nr:hypothetical protein [Winslowiella toletana]
MQTNLVNDRMPLLIPSAGFDTKLSMTEKNIEHSESFIASGVNEFSLPGFVIPHGYRLLSSVKGDQYRLVTDSEIPETIYAVKLALHDRIITGRNV